MDPRELRLGIEKLSRVRRRAVGAVAGQPFDAYLLSVSPLYRRSRGLYLKQKGKFEPAYSSSQRILSSAILLENRIEYTPHEKEICFAARDERALAQLRTLSVCLFHEQNHRVLWKRLPLSSPGPAAIRRYLNWVEALVIGLDMALGDELGHGQSRFFYGLGVLYDPGTSWKSRTRKIPKRTYRNRIQAAIFATYLALELYRPQEIRKVAAQLFPIDGIQDAVDRALRLDAGFIARTNQFWQKKHAALIRKACSAKRGGITIPEDPLDHRIQYLKGEQILELFGL